VRVKNAALVRQFGQEVRRRRGELGLSQEELAGVSGLHRTYVSGIECGERNPTIDVVFVLASALQCKPADLMPEPTVDNVDL
jgi:transcriptional regulator with XRE-family HTH domain